MLWEWLNGPPLFAGGAPELDRLEPNGPPVFGGATPGVILREELNGPPVFAVGMMGVFLWEELNGPVTVFEKGDWESLGFAPMGGPVLGG